MRVTSPKYSLARSFDRLSRAERERKRERRRERRKGREEKGGKERVEETAERGRSRVSDVASVAANVHETRLILRRSRFLMRGALHRPTVRPSASVGGAAAFRLRVCNRVQLLLSAFDWSGLEGGSAAYQLSIHLLPLSATRMRTKRGQAN